MRCIAGVENQPGERAIGRHRQPDVGVLEDQDRKLQQRLDKHGERRNAEQQDRRAINTGRSSSSTDGLRSAEVMSMRGSVWCRR